MERDEGWKEEGSQTDSRVPKARSGCSFQRAAKAEHSRVLSSRDIALTEAYRDLHNNKHLEGVTVGSSSRPQSLVDSVIFHVDCSG